MVLVSVLLALACAQVGRCRRLTNDMDNEISVSPGNAPFRDQEEWIKISAAPKSMVRKAMGSYVELECEAMGSPPPTLQWFRGDKEMSPRHQDLESNIISEVPSQGLGKIRARLVINYLLPVHSGIFTCVAESGSKVATADTTISVTKKEGYEQNFTQLLASKVIGVHHIPRISLWAPTYMDVMGTNVILPCRTFGNPKPSQRWFDPQGQVIEEGAGRVSALPDGSLSIRSLTWDDMGVYTCITKNIVGEDNVETFLYPMKESK